MIGPLVLVFATAGAFVLRHWWLGRQIRAELARIGAAGEAVTVEDLAAMYRVPPAEQDATTLWLDAIAPLEGPAYGAACGGLSIVGSEDEPPLPGQPWPDRAAAERFLRQQAPSLRLLHKAAAMGGAARHPDEFREGWTMLTPHLRRLRAAARLLQLEASVHAHQGDARRVAASYDALFALGRSLEKEPNVVSQLVRVAIDGMTTSHLERLLPLVDFSDAEMVHLQQELRAARYERAFNRALQGDRVAAIQFFEESGASGVVHLWYKEWVVATRREYLSYLRLMRETMIAARDPWPEGLREATRLSNHGPKEREVRLLGVSASNVANTLGLDNSPAWFTTFARYTAWNRAVDAAVAIQRFQRRCGRLPDDLKELTPEFLPAVPEDPFDGKPLRYVVRDDAYVLYSVGADGTDDGGHGDERGEPDVVFRVERRGADRPEVLSP